MNSQRNFTNFIKSQLRLNQEALETMNIIIEDNVGRPIDEIQIECEYANTLFEEIKQNIERWTGKDYCPWGDEEMIFHDESVIQLCFGNTKSDLETLVWSYYENTGKINSYLYEFMNGI